MGDLQLLYFQYTKMRRLTSISCGDRYFRPWTKVRTITKTNYQTMNYYVCVKGKWIDSRVVTLSIYHNDHTASISCGNTHFHWNTCKCAHYGLLKVYNTRINPFFFDSNIVFHGWVIGLGSCSYLGSWLEMFFSTWYTSNSPHYGILKV